MIELRHERLTSAECPPLDVPRRACMRFFTGAWVQGWVVAIGDYGEKSCVQCDGLLL